MTTITQFPSDATAWLDARGKGAWIAAMVLGFVFLWPVGLAILFFMIWSNRMSCSHKKSHHRARWANPNTRSTGNHAFDSYRDETLKRLEEEQEAFQSFLDRLRQAKDKSEFDHFMDERRAKTVETEDDAA